MAGGDSCYICGADDARARDHLFPGLRFSRPLPPDMLTAPACEECQQRLQPDEEYFRTFAAAGSYPAPIRTSLPRKLSEGRIKRSFDNRPASGRP